MARIGRRSFALSLASLAAARGVLADESALDCNVLTLAGRRVLVAIPRAYTPPLRVAVLLHGLGETGDAETGARAFVDHYGLVSCDARLRNPPVAKTNARGDFPAAEVARINADLTAAPFRGLAYVCPHMPNLQTSAVAVPYGAWIRNELLPALRPVLPRDIAPSMALGGCSLGGYVALEIAAAGDTTFDLLCGVQSAISASSAQRFAPKLTAKKMYFATSSWDPYHNANEALTRELAKLGKDVTFRSFPGPHDQPWLREVGTLDLIAWLDRAL
jgi:predicted esterase